jgi:plasmid stabilization system protein ParE
MTLAIRLREEADLDLAEAAAWYELRRAGLGQAFLDEALSLFRSVATRPLSYPVVHRDTRRALMGRFPFGVFYRVTSDQIVVVAVIHASRHPRYWKQRG